MFFSNTALIMEIKNENQPILRNISFEEDNNFFSLFINKDGPNTVGEIHWSNSFKYGKLNIVHFIQLNTKVILFTSSTQNTIPFKKIINHILPNSEVQMFRLPLPVPNRKINLKEIQKLDIDECFGLTMILNVINETILSKVYTNGVLTFSTLNNIQYDDAIYILNLIIKVIEEFNE